MFQNIYDDPCFFAGYKQLRDTNSGLNDVLEQPALHAMLPALSGLQILELGCGMGQFAAYCVQHGAAEVVGVDISRKMLDVAEAENRHERIKYVHSAIETVDFAPEQFDLVVSSLALHYVSDFEKVASSVSMWLKAGGSFIFSVEHPICTAQIGMNGWVRGNEGQELFWPVDNYASEGRREQRWFVDGVVKYHRRIATYINCLLRAAMSIEEMSEPEAIAEAIIARPKLELESRRPAFLLIHAKKN